LDSLWFLCEIGELANQGRVFFACFFFGKSDFALQATLTFCHQFQKLAPDYLNKKLKNGEKKWKKKTEKKKKKKKPENRNERM
jgi:hypothetical protein